jgi:GNAT superfamily N-acetyltransferase
MSTSFSMREPYHISIPSSLTPHYDASENLAGTKSPHPLSIIHYPLSIIHYPLVKKLPSFTQATFSSRHTLAALMRDFYAEQSLLFTSTVIAAMENLLSDDGLGFVYLVHTDIANQGYFVLTYGYSLERAGPTALLDELYITPPARRQGLATAALHIAAELARTAGCRSLHLEVDHDNPIAHALYTRLGFITHHRHYLTLPLIPPH